MITRFDHLVIAVPNLDTAIDESRQAGFDVAAGGRHPGLGTHNAIIRFGLDYIELLAIENAEQARAAGPFGAELDAALGHGAGAVGFVLASDGLESESAGLDAIGLAQRGPFDMDRERPDGHRLAWRLVIPGQSPWLKPWPFLIQWETPDTDRLRWDAPGHHTNGARRVVGLELVVDDLEWAAQFYEQGLGLERTAAAGQLLYVLDDFRLMVREPADAAEQANLRTRGPGPQALLLNRDASTADREAAEFTTLGTRFRFT